MVPQQNSKVAAKPIISKSTNRTAVNDLGASVSDSSLLPNPSPLQLTPTNYKKGKFDVKSLLYIGFGVALLGIGSLAFAYYQTSKEGKLRALQDQMAVNSRTVDTEFELSENATINLSAAAKTLHELGNKTPEAYNRLTLEFFLKRPRLAMAHGIGQAPFKLIPKNKWFWGYFYADQGKTNQVGQRLAVPNTNVIYSELFKDDDYPTKEYWTIPINLGKSTWIEPYDFYGINMTSYLDVLRDAKGEILGISSVDLNITEMAKLINALKTFDSSSYNVLLTDKGTIITYPPDQKLGENREKIQRVPELANIWSKIPKENQGLIISDGKVWTYRKLPSNDWVMLEAVPEISLYSESLFRSISGSMIAVIILSSIFILYLRTLKQSDSLAVLLGIQEKITERQKADARIAEIQSQVWKSSNIDELNTPLSSYMAEIRQDLNCDRVVVYRFVSNAEGKNAGMIVAESALANLPSAMKTELSDSFIHDDSIDEYKAGRVVATMDVFNAGFDPDHLDMMSRLRIKSSLVVPVLRAGELDSLLIAHSCTKAHEWLESEIKLMQDYAEEIGRALGGLATLEQQQLIAAQERLRSETLQRELFGLVSDVEGATQGDLTVRAQITEGEIGIVADFFNAIVESLRDVVSQVKQATAKVNSSVGDNDIAIRGLADDATLQAQQLDDALQSVEKMTVSIQDVAKNAKQASDASSSAANTAELGSQAIERSAESILQLRQTVAETAKKVKRLGEASQQISKVVVLIDQIALKTNMLAVNASIEAAKAGEEGRGFAVVAEEVGVLAAQSATATKEIERIVTTIQRETSEVVEAMESSTEQVVAGTQQVESARNSLAQIVQSSQKVNELFQSISGATVSQVQTSQAVKALMQNLATMSQKSSQTSRNVSEALQQTVDVASQLQASVETFKVDA